MFLREYIDRIFNESTKVPKKRARLVIPNNFHSEVKAPFQAPNWTIGDYNGHLKTEVQRACDRRSSTTLPIQPLPPPPPRKTTPTPPPPRETTPSPLPPSRETTPPPPRKTTPPPPRETTPPPPQATPPPSHKKTKGTRMTRTRTRS